MNINATLKNVQVEFYSDTTSTPSRMIDTSCFNQKGYNDIMRNGHYLTDLNLIHCASIHYQSRFSNNVSRRFRHTLDTIEPSLIDNQTNFYFNHDEEIELQKTSSEVIGVGFAISLFQKLLDVNFNCITRILPVGRDKRCDFQIYRNGSVFILESKGRKRDINGARHEIYNQKLSRTGVKAKYGCIAKITRDYSPVSITVVDPPTEDIPQNENDRLIDLLIYYTKAVQLSGFFNLARHLNQRIDYILANKETIDNFDRVKVDYGSVIKHGHAVRIAINNGKFEIFISRDRNVGLEREIENGNDRYTMLFGLDPELVDILEQQDFQALLEYKHDQNDDIKNDGTILSTHNDGTFLGIVPTNVLITARL